MNRYPVQLTLVACLLCAAVVALPVPARAAATGQDHLQAMIDDGWQPVAPGVLQRTRGGQKVETYAIGAEGFRWMLEDLRGRLGFLVDENRRYPSPKLRQAIRGLEAEIARTRTYIAQLEAGEPKALEGCDFAFGAHADAYPTRTVQGVRADSDAYANNNCYVPCDVYTNDYARATLNGVTTTVQQSCTRPSGPNVSCSSTASVVGDTDCFSEALGRVTCVDAGISYQTMDQNFVCPVPLTVTIVGPTSRTIWNYSCSTVTWTASVFGGSSPYSYSWYIDGYFAGSGSSLSRTYCGNGTQWTNTENVSLTVTDSLQWTASDTHVTYIYFRVNIDPCLEVLSQPDALLPQPCYILSNPE